MDIGEKKRRNLTPLLKVPYHFLPINGHNRSITHERVVNTGQQFTALKELTRRVQRIEGNYKDV